MSGSVSVGDDESVSGSGLSLELFESIRAVEEAVKPLPSLTPPVGWEGTAEAWLRDVRVWRLRTLRAWAREAGRHAKAQVGRWHNVHYELFAAPATTHLISGLDGDAHRVYRLRFNVVRGTPTPSDLRLRPNSDAANGRQRGVWTQGGTVSASERAWIEPCWLGATDPCVGFGELLIYAASGQSRHMSGFSCFVTDATINHHTCSAAWTVASGNLTELLLWTPASNSIGAGSEVWLDRNVQP